MQTEVRLFLYAFYANEYPKPNPDVVMEIQMDAIPDMGVRTFLMSLKRALSRVPENASLKECVDSIKESNSVLNPLYVGYPLFDKYFNAPNPNTLWVSIKRKNSDAAYGFWLSTTTIQDL